MGTGFHVVPGLFSTVILGINTFGSTRGGASDIGIAYKVGLLSPGVQVKDPLRDGQPRTYIRPRKTNE